MEKIKAIILAAGIGSRLQCEKDDIPKALHLVSGRPLIDYVLEGINFIKQEDITVVIGSMGEKIIEHLGDEYHYCRQHEQKGTAHAVLCAEDQVKGFSGPVMILYCDMPLIRRETYMHMITEHIAAGAKNTLLSALIHPIPAFGRLLRDEKGELLDIVEDSACTAEQKLIDEVNVGIQVISGDVIWDCLHRVSNQNPKHEYYLTGVVRIMHDLGYRQHIVVLEGTEEYWGVNTLEDLEKVEEHIAKARIHPQNSGEHDPKIDINLDSVCENRGTIFNR